MSRGWQGSGVDTAELERLLNDLFRGRICVSSPPPSIISGIGSRVSFPSCVQFLSSLPRLYSKASSCSVSRLSLDFSPGQLQEWQGGSPPCVAEAVARTVIFSLPQQWLDMLPPVSAAWSAVERSLLDADTGGFRTISYLRRQTRHHLTQFAQSDLASSPKPLASDPAGLMGAYMEALRRSCAWHLYRRDLSGDPVDSPFADRLHVWWDTHRLHCHSCRLRGSWESAKASNPDNPCYIADILAMLHWGWLLPFTRLPHPKDLPNYDSILMAPEAIEKDFMRMQAAGVFGGHGSPVVISPLQAVIKTSDVDEAIARLIAAGFSWEDLDNDSEGFVDCLNVELHRLGLAEVKARLCVDLSRVVNNLLRDVGFAFPPFEEFVAILVRHAFMTKLDYSRCFWNIPVHLAHQPFMGLRWKEEVYLACRILFGIKLGPCIASILTAETRLAFLAMGIPCSTYIDDTGSMGRSKGLCQWRQDIMAALASCLGWPINLPKKKEDGPSQSLAFRGVLVDTVSGTLQIPPNRILRALTLLTSIQDLGGASGRDWRRLLGYLEWFSQVIPNGRPHLAPLWDGIPKFFDNNWRVPLSAPARAELAWWSFTLSRALTGDLSAWVCMWSGPWPHMVRIFSDAAGSDGFAAVVDGMVIVGEWSLCWETGIMKDPSSGWKELVPVYFALRLVAPKLPRDSIVVVTTDNLANAFNFNFGSAGRASRQLFQLIWDVACAHHLHLVGDWLPREINTFPDALSRLPHWPPFRQLWAAATYGRSSA